MVWKWLVCMNSSILVSYCDVGIITIEFPLSARVIMAPFSFNFVFMFLMVLDSECVFCVCGDLLLTSKVLMRSAVIFLYTSRSEGGRYEMAVSASSAKFWIQSFGLSCNLYLGPFCSMATSGSEKDTSVMFTTRGWNLLLGGSLCACCCVRHLILLICVLGRY